MYPPGGARSTRCSALGQIAAFMAVGRGQVRRGAVFYALAGLVKVQAFILLPVFAVLQWQRGGLRRMLHSGEVLVSVLVLAALPFFLVGQGASLFRSSGQAGGTAAAWLLRQCRPPYK